MTFKSGNPILKFIHITGITLALLFASGCAPAEVATPTAEPSPTATIQPTATIEPTTAILPTAAIEPTAAEQSVESGRTSAQPSPTSTQSTLASSAFITNISGHVQTYELGCEASAAVDWAGYFDVLIYESTFQFALPLSDNPELGFVGSVTTDGWGQIPPDAYGVHAAPIAALLREYDLPAVAVKEMTLEEVKAELAEGDPIIAWVIGNMVYSEPVTYTDEEGNAVIVSPYEHVVILTGYDEENIYYMNNGKFYSVPTDVFLTSWGVLENMAVIYD